MGYAERAPESVQKIQEAAALVQEAHEIIHRKGSVTNYEFQRLSEALNELQDQKRLLERDYAVAPIVEPKDAW
jgi:hypothetical protein